MKAQIPVVKEHIKKRAYIFKTRNKRNNMEYYKRFAATKELGKINADILNEGINFFARHHSPQPQNLPQQSNNAFFFHADSVFQEV
ncbi:MAG: hypothetical protein IPK76_19390 [Lewinellaceae bacterium]|nr:hypothetical protein [Lewinellaceae bacterium]